MCHNWHVLDSEKAAVCVCIRSPIIRMSHFLHPKVWNFLFKSKLILVKRGILVWVTFLSRRIIWVSQRGTNPRPAKNWGGVRFKRTTQKVADCVVSAVRGEAKHRRPFWRRCLASQPSSITVEHEALPWTCDRRVFFFFLLLVERKSRFVLTSSRIYKRKKKKTPLPQQHQPPLLSTDFPPLVVPFFFNPVHPKTTNWR